MSAKNIPKNEVQTSAIEKPSFASSTKDSGAINSLRGDEGKLAGDGDTMPELKKRNCKATMHSKTKCDQEAQTELSALLVPVAMTSFTMVRHSARSTRKNSL